MDYNNINSAINGENIDCNTLLDLGLSKIKSEFNEEETKIQHGVLENQLNEERVDNSSTDIIKLHDSVFPENILKTESKTSEMFSEKDGKIDYGAVKIEKNEEFSSDHESSNIKCEFEEEKTKIQYGVLENQLQQEKIEDSSLDIIELHNGAFPGSFLKTETTASNTFFKDNVKIECGEVKSEVNESNKEFNASMVHELSIIKCEFEEEETKIQFGVLENQLPNKIYLGETHKRIRAGGIRFKCETCGQSFSKKGNLNRHMRIHTGEQPYKCEKCGKSFKEKSSLTKHMRIHTGEKPYKCETCGKCFIWKTNLNPHMRIHTGEKPYKCETCSKCFIRKTDLNFHMKVHAGEEPNKCETCGKCYIRKAGLNFHMKIHAGEKPYKCETCGKSFSQKKYLNAHSNRIHTDGKA